MGRKRITLAKVLNVAIGFLEPIGQILAKRASHRLRRNQELGTGHPIRDAIDRCLALLKVLDEQ